MEFGNCTSEIIKFIKTVALSRGGEVESRLAHNQKFGSSILPPATVIKLYPKFYNDNPRRK